MRDAMKHLLLELRTALPAAFEREDYRVRRDLLGGFGAELDPAVARAVVGPALAELKKLGLPFGAKHRADRKSVV